MPACPGHPGAPKKTLPEHVKTQKEFLEGKLDPVLEQAKQGKGHVFFADATHCVFGSYLCCLWSFVRLYVRSASGRQRFNVLGAWDAVTREFVSVTNTTVVNALTMCELLGKIAALGLAGPVTVVLDNARYQKCALVTEAAAKVGITLLYLPSYSPNLNLIERLWRFIKRDALYGHWHPTFADFKGAIEGTISELRGKHKDKIASLMTLNFQVFDDVSLLAA